MRFNTRQLQMVVDYFRCDSVIEAKRITRNQKTEWNKYWASLSSKYRVYGANAGFIIPYQEPSGFLGMLSAIANISFLRSLRNRRQARENFIKPDLRSQSQIHERSKANKPSQKQR